MKLSKSTQAHAKMAHFLLIILTIYPFEGVLDKNISFVEAFLQSALSDANSEARHKGRRAFLAWEKRCPRNASQMFQILDYSIQRAIIEEKDSSSGGYERSLVQDSQPKITASHFHKAPSNKPSKKQ